MKRTVLLFHSPGEMGNIPIIASGLWGIADSLYKDGFETKIVHLGLEEKLYGDKFEPKKYIDKTVVLIGFSVQWFQQLKHSLEIAKVIKEFNKNITIAFGGYTASFFYKEILSDYKWIDGILRGDGEIPLSALAKSIVEDYNKLNLVPNYCWRKDNEIIENEFSYIATDKDIENLSFGKYYKYLLNYNYVIAEYKRISEFPNIFSEMKPYTSKTFYMTIGRGCLQECVYCGGGKHAQKVLNNREICLMFPDEVIERTLQEAVIEGFKNIYLCFDAFPNNNAIIKVLKIIQKKKYDLALTIGVWGAITSETIVELTNTSKHIIVEISPETISESLRKKSKGKFFSNKILYDNIDEMIKNGIHVQIFFGYFLPSDTCETVNETRRNGWALKIKYPKMAEVQYLRYSTDPASPIYIEPEKHNLKLKVKSLEEHLEYAVKNANNVMIHEINTIDPKIQKKLDDMLRYDLLLQLIFKEGCSLLVLEYKEINDFLKIIDRFYEYDEQTKNTDNKLSLSYQNVTNVLYRLYKFLEVDQGKNSFFTEVVLFYYCKYYVIYKSIVKDISTVILDNEKQYIYKKQNIIQKKLNYNIFELFNKVCKNGNIGEIVKNNYYVAFTTKNNTSNIIEISQEEFTILELISNAPLEVDTVILTVKEILSSIDISHDDKYYLELIKKLINMELIFKGGMHYIINK